MITYTLRLNNSQKESFRKLSKKYNLAITVNRLNQVHLSEKTYLELENALKNEVKVNDDVQLLDIGYLLRHQMTKLHTP